MSYEAAAAGLQLAKLQHGLVQRATSIVGAGIAQSVQDVGAWWGKHESLRCGVIVLQAAQELRSCDCYCWAHAPCGLYLQRPAAATRALCALRWCGTCVGPCRGKVACRL
jgi:hypothetical protein